MYIIIIIITTINFIETLHCSCKAYLSIKSTFFPIVGATLHCSHRFSAGMVSVVGLRPPRLAPGMSFSQRAVLSMARASLDQSVVNHSCTHSLSHSSCSACTAVVPADHSTAIFVVHMASLQLNPHALILIF